MHKGRAYIKIFAPLAVLLAVLVVAAPRGPRWSYEYGRGLTWKYEDLIAEFDFPILKTEEQIAAEKSARSSVATPYYKYSAAVGSEVASKAVAAVSGSSPKLAAIIGQTLSNLYEKGIVPDAPALESDVIYVQRDRRAQLRPADDVYTVSDAYSALKSELETSSDAVTADSLLECCGIRNLLTANLTYDQQTTALIQDDLVADVSPTSGYVRAGELIVSQGELVTVEIEQILDSYKREYEHNVGPVSGSLKVFGGNLLLCLALVAMLYIALLFADHKIPSQHYKGYLYILTLYLIAALAAMLPGKWDSDWLLSVPFTLTALYMQAFFKTRTVFPLYFASLLPLLVFAENGPVLFTMNFVAGSAAICLFKYLGKGAAQFLLAGIVFVISVLIYGAFGLTGTGDLSSWAFDLLRLFVGSMLIVACYPLIYLFEKIFNLTSNTRLQEIADTGCKLLRQLESSAPGTFQHSLQVMNMCEAAARRIGANEFLIRAGALYHDIGKLKDPSCFVENESLQHKGEGARYHDNLTPLQSAQAIIKHVSDGLDIAREHHLPIRVRRMIESHHGTTCVSYFYSKHLSQGGSEESLPDFCYKGVKPISPEEVILMLCDSIEAASRTLKDNSEASISALVEKIFAAKMEEGQFSEAEISISELGQVKDEIKTHLAEMYHGRIKYPERNKSNKR